MANRSAQFDGSIPAHYDRHLGPLFFEPFAEDMARRVTATSAVLELACGTGIVTRHLRMALPPGASLVATDLNEAMLDYARAALPGAAVEWQQADAQALPFPDAQFDAVVCQFGLMFLPDKSLGFREAGRVLRPGGRFLFNVWASLDANPIALLAHEEVRRLVPDDPPMFIPIPFSLDDVPLLTRLAAGAGLTVRRTDRIRLEAEAPSAAGVARGLVLGNPTQHALRDRGITDVEPLIAAVGTALALVGGDAPFRMPMEAVVLEAVKR